MIEAFFRITKSLLETRLVFHKYDDTIRGHIFSSFLALLLRHELMSSLTSRGEKPEWADIVRDLAALQEGEVEQDGHRYRLRLPLQGVCGKVFQAVGVAVPSPVRAVQCGAKALPGRRKRPPHGHWAKPAVEDELQ